MNTYTAAAPSAFYLLMTAQALLGAWDNLWNHELGARLPHRYAARHELALHSARGLVYAPVFFACAWLQPTGALAASLLGLLALEVLITLADFVEEDRSRTLGAGERVLHTLMALNYGVLLSYLVPAWWASATAPTTLAWVEHGNWSWLLSAFALGAAAWGVRDGIAAWKLARLPWWQQSEVHIAENTAPRAVLVVGATGFLGQAICRRLIMRGERLTVCARDVAKARRLYGPYARVVGALEEIKQSEAFYAVINLAGAPVATRVWTSARKALLVESRVGTTRALVDWLALQTKRAQVLVNASAVGWYGVHPANAFAESGASGDDFPARMCRAWEREACAAEDLGVRVALLRFGLVLGAGGLLARLLPVFRGGLGAPFGSGAQWMPWVHIDDVVAVLEQALEDDQLEGAFNVVAPEATTNRKFSAALARKLHRPLWPALPDTLIRYAFGEMALLLLEGQRVVPARLMSIGYRFRFPRLDDALRDLVGGRSALRHE